jgi:hypothetical protein
MTDLIHLAAHRPKASPCPLSQARCRPVVVAEPQGLAAVIDLAERRRASRLAAVPTPRRSQTLPRCPFAPRCWLRPATWRCPLVPIHRCPSCSGPAA